MEGIEGRRRGKKVGDKERKKSHNLCWFIIKRGFPRTFLLCKLFLLEVCTHHTQN